MHVKTTHWPPRLADCGNKLKLWKSADIIDHDDARIHSLDPAAVRVRETSRARTGYVSNTRGSVIALRNVPFHASGSRETTPAVRESGGRRRLGISPHLCHGPENEDFVFS